MKLDRRKTHWIIPGPLRLYLQHLPGMLLCLLNIGPLLFGEGEAVHGQQVPGIDLEGPP